MPSPRIWGNEFRGLEAAVAGGVVHRQKDPSDRNATAVVDRAIQTLKKDLTGKVARDGGGWGQHVEKRHRGLRRPTAPGNHGGPGGCRDDAGRDFQGLPA